MIYFRDDFHREIFIFHEKLAQWTRNSIRIDFLNIFIPKNDFFSMSTHWRNFRDEFCIFFNCTGQENKSDSQ